MNRYLNSGRSQQRLMELHRAISSSVQTLNQHHTVLVGAILGCDAGTQQRVLDEHRTLVQAASDAIARLGMFAEQCRVGASPLGANEANVDSPGDALPLRA